MEQPIKHQIVRQLIVEPGPKYRQIVTCTCGRRIANTTSLAAADRKAQYHLDAAD